MLKSFNILLAFTLCVIISCSENNTIDTLPEQENTDNTDSETIVNDLANPVTSLETPLGIAEYFNGSLIDNGYILVNDAKANRVYLMNKKAEILFEWNLSGKNLGNDAFLLSNGKLLIMTESDDPKIKFGGQAGVVEILDRNGNSDWNFEYSSEDYISHHDAELLPNGNILIQIWERKPTAIAIEAGASMEIDLFPDGLLEINPTNNEIVWEWHSWDHLIQDHDPTKSNYGTIAENPQLINLNYVQNEDGDIMHANGISYDKKHDLIYLSVNFFSEVWVIDHSTTTDEAASNRGGNYNKGGDLIYRFGNPNAYQNNQGNQIFDHNHYPNLLTGANEGKMLIFSNGFTTNQSTAYEISIPDPLTLHTASNNEPTILWSFTHEELFSPKVSGVVQLPNGNRLITEGDSGFWEVTLKGEVVWRFKGEGFFWRGYNYKKDAPAIRSLGI